MVERSLPTPEICGSYPVIGTFYYLSTINYLSTTLKADNKEEEAMTWTNFLIAHQRRSMNRFRERERDEQVKRKGHILASGILAKSNIECKSELDTLVGRKTDKE